MESAVKRGTVLRVGFSVILSISYFTLGCSSDNSSGPTVDAGKKDGGKGGSGGSSSNGGSSGSGGSSAKGGSSGSGGSSASGGSSGSGGSSNAGGSSASGGTSGSAGSSASGGSSGSGGSSKSGGAGGSGGTGGVDGGGVQLDGGRNADAETSDAQDAPLLGEDGAASEAGASHDGGTTVLLDTSAQDSERLDSEAIDIVAIHLDAELDTSVVDAPADSAAVLDSTLADAGTCLEQIISSGYAVSTLNACSQCKDTIQPTIDLHTQCQDMVNCMEAASCENPADNCFFTCRNAVTLSQVDTGNCVAALVSAACHE